MLENDPFLPPGLVSVSVSVLVSYSSLIVDVLERLDWILNGLKDAAVRICKHLGHLAGSPGELRRSSL